MCGTGHCSLWNTEGAVGLPEVCSRSCSNQDMTLMGPHAVAMANEWLIVAKSQALIRFLTAAEQRGWKLDSISISCRLVQPSSPLTMLLPQSSVFL